MRLRLPPRSLPTSVNAVFYLSLVLILGSLPFASSCNHNPFAIAQSPEQQVYALERTYNIVLAQAVKAVQAPEISDPVKTRIRRAEQQATPAIDAMSSALRDYMAAKSLLVQGTTSDEQVAILAANLDKWVTQAEIAVAAFSAAVE